MGEPSVVMITVNNGNYTLRCTGVLVDREWVVTLAYCISPTITNLPSQQAVTAAVTINAGTEDTTIDPGMVLSALQTIPKPAFDVGMIAVSNIGLVKLATPVDTITPARVNFDAALAPVGVAPTTVSFLNMQRVSSSRMTTSCATFGHSDQTLHCFPAATPGTFFDCMPAAAFLTINGKATLVSLIGFADQNCSLYAAGPRTDAEKTFLVSHVPQLEASPEAPVAMLDGGPMTDTGGCCHASANSSSLLLASLLALLFALRNTRTSRPDALS